MTVRVPAKINILKINVLRLLKNHNYSFTQISRPANAACELEFANRILEQGNAYLSRETLQLQCQNDYLSKQCYFDSEQCVTND